jgi:hypothetical protein
MREFEEDQVLRLAENVKFHRVCELVYRKQRKFAKVLTSIIKDSSRHDQVRQTASQSSIALFEFFFLNGLILTVRVSWSIDVCSDAQPDLARGSQPI